MQSVFPGPAQNPEGTWLPLEEAPGMVEWPATLAVLRAVARLGPGAGADRPGSPEAGGRRERSQRRGALTRARGPHPTPPLVVGWPA